MARRSLSYLTPDQVSGLVAWYKADALSLNDDDLVTSFTDSSGNGYHGLGSDGSRPTYKTNILNGKPVIRLAGSQGRQITGAPAEAAFDLSTYTIFFVAVRSSGSGAVVLSKNTTGTGGAGRRKLQCSIASTSFSFSSGADGSSISISATTTDWNIYGLVARGNSDHDMWLNGEKTNKTTTLGDSTFNDSGPEIGQAFNNGAERLIGDIAEIILYSGALGDEQCIGIQNYLSAKYGLTGDGLGGYPRNAEDQRIFVPKDTQYSLLFSGSEGNFVSSTLWNSLNASYTMSARFRTTDYTQNRQVIMSNGNGAGGPGRGLAIILSGDGTTDGSMYVLNHNVAWHSLGFKVQDDKWHHIVCVVNANNTVTVYFDNEPKGTVSPLAATPNTNSYIGKDNAGGFFYGNIKDALVFGLALTSDQAEELYLNKLTSVTPTNRYSFNEGSGSTAIDTGSAPKNGTIDGADYSTNVPFQKRA